MLCGLCSEFMGKMIEKRRRGKKRGGEMKEEIRGEEIGREERGG